MYFKSATIISTLAVLFAGQAMSAVLIATDPVSACNCPNNCGYNIGTGCKYKAGVSTDGSTVEGSCAIQNGALTCIPK